MTLSESVARFRALDEAQLDLAKTKIMAKNLRKLWKDTGAIIRQHGYTLGSGSQWFDAFLKDLDEKGNLSVASSEFLVKAADDIVKAAEQSKPKLVSIAKKYAASAKRMHDLNKKQDVKDRAAVRQLKKSKLDKARLKKGAYIAAYKGGKEIHGSIRWIGPSKFKKGEMTYGLSVPGGTKLVYVATHNIFEVLTSAATAQYEPDDGDHWHDASKDMNAELGTKGVNYSKAAIKAHFGWK